MRSLPVLMLLLVLILAAAVPVQGEQAERTLGSIKVTKKASIPDEIGRRVISQLVVTNNGTIPVSAIEIYEYFNVAFKLTPTATLRYRGAEIESPIVSAVGGSTFSQFIVMLPQPGELKPGESAILEYVTETPAPGDFQVPTSLVWFSFKYGAGLIRLNIYSNGLMVHIPNETEVLLARTIPFIASGLTFVGILFSLDKIFEHARPKRNG